MVRVYCILYLCAAISIVAAGNVAVSAELHQYLSFTVPGLDGGIEKIELADIDGDNFAEVLACDGHNVVLFSLPNGIILADTLDSDYRYYQLELADVNRDSVFDCLILLASGASGGYYQTEFKVRLYDNLLSDPTPQLALEFSQESILGVGLLKAVDLNGDGYNNLILSVDSSESYENYLFFMFWDVSHGWTEYYYSFPDSCLMHQTNNLSTLDVCPTESSHRIAVTLNSYRYEDMPTLPGVYSSGSQVSILDSSLTVLSSTSESAPSTCSGDFLVSDADMMTAEWVGNLDTAENTIEVLGTFMWGRGCESSTGISSVTGSSIVMYRLLEDGSFTRVWEADADSLLLGQFIAHPDFPDQFFATAGDTLMRFSATDGSLLRRYDDPLPLGVRFWDYPYGDDYPYLVIVNHDTVSYHGFGEVTAVETNDNDALLPTTFTLGQPYPNPFNPTVTLPIALQEKGHLTVEVFNPLGQRVATIHDATTSAGEFDLTWDAGGFASGVYLFKATVEDQTATVKAVLLK